jgi:hypothetical protein
MATKRVTPDESLAPANDPTPGKKRKTATKRAKPNGHEAYSPTSIDRDARHNLVAAEAYYLAERRGFTAGHELEDWVAAEQAIDSRLMGMPAS